MMYDLVSELQHRSEELDRRIVALEDKLDSILLSVQSLPVVLSQAITKLQKDFLDDLACRVHFLSSSLSSECCSVPARPLCPGPTTPETPYSSLKKPCDYNRAKYRNCRPGETGNGDMCTSSLTEPHLGHKAASQCAQRKCPD